MPDWKMRGLPSKAPDLILDMDEDGFPPYTVGISFPPYPRLLERCWRTDIRGGMMFFWNGTYWLSEQQFTYEYTAENLTVTSVVERQAMPKDLGVYLTRCDATIWVSTTNDGSNYWTFQLERTTAGTAVSTTIVTFNTAGVTSGGYRVIYGGMLNVLLDNLTDAVAVVTLLMVKTGTAGPCYPSLLLYYRLRAT